MSRPKLPMPDQIDGMPVDALSIMIVSEPEEYVTVNVVAADGATKNYLLMRDDTRWYLGREVIIK